MMDDGVIDDREAAYQRREDVIKAAMIRAAFLAARGLTPSQACNLGCATCGVIDAKPCNQCTVSHVPSEDSEGGEL